MENNLGNKEIMAKKHHGLLFHLINGQDTPASKRSEGGGRNARPAVP